MRIEMPHYFRQIFQGLPYGKIESIVLRSALGTGQKKIARIDPLGRNDLGIDRSIYESDEEKHLKTLAGVGGDDLADELGAGVGG